jgi:RNA polymerase sigma-70 factor (ECF subfamily)
MQAVKLPSVPACHGAFNSTHWSVVLQAGDAASPQAGEALEELCRTYWYPLYAYVRRRGYAPEDAQDLTQAFFLHLLQGPFLTRADQTKGKFRSYLLGAFEHFLAKEWRRAHRQKRGGRRAIVALDAEPGEDRYSLEPGCELTPETLYNQTWALTLLEKAITALQAEWVAADKGRLFEELKSLLDGERPETPYSDLAVRLGMGEGALRMAAHRLRKRYGQLLREEIAQTLASPDEIDAEIRFLFAALPR